MKPSSEQKIFSQLLGLFLIFAIVPISLLGLVTYTSFRSTLEKTIGKNHLKLAQETINKVDREMDEIIKISQMIASYPDLNSKNLEKLLAPFPCFKEGKLIEKKTEETTVSDVFYQPVLETAGMEIIVPLEQVDKSLSLFFDIQSISDIVSGLKLDKTGYLILLNKEGKALVAPNLKPEEILQPDYNFLRATQEALKREAGYKREFNEKGRPSLISFAPSLGYGRFKNLGWIILAIIDESEVFAPVQRLTWFALVLIFLVSLLALPLSFLLADRMYRAIRRLLSLNKTIIENTPVALFTFDKEGKIISFNRNAEILEKRAATEVLGSSIFDDPLVLKLGLEGKIKEVLEKGFSFFFFKLRLDKKVFNVWLSPLREKLSTLGGILVLDEITKEVRLEEVIKEVEERLALEKDKLSFTVINLLDGFIFYNKFLEIIIFSQGAEKLLGVKKNEILGRSVSAILKETKFSFLFPIFEDLGKEKISERKIEIQGKILTVRTAPIFEEKKNLIGFVQIIFTTS